jgi:hypothetical protein
MQRILSVCVVLLLVVPFCASAATSASGPEARQAAVAAAAPQQAATIDPEVQAALQTITLSSLANLSGTPSRANGICSISCQRCILGQACPPGAGTCQNIVCP